MSEHERNIDTLLRECAAEFRRELQSESDASGPRSEQVLQAAALELRRSSVRKKQLLPGAVIFRSPALRWAAACAAVVLAAVLVRAGRDALQELPTAQYAEVESSQEGDLEDLSIELASFDIQEEFEGAFEEEDAAPSEEGEDLAFEWPDLPLVFYYSSLEEIEEEDEDNIDA